MSSDTEEVARQGASASRWTRVGLLLAVVFVVLLLAFVFIPNRQQSGDTVGENDAGVAHPDPIGVDDDVTGAR